MGDPCGRPPRPRRAVREAEPLRGRLPGHHARNSDFVGINDWRLRLQLRVLEQAHLRLALEAPAVLAQELQICLPADLWAEPVPRAISMKLAKMNESPDADVPWLSYWLIVRQDEPQGIGMLGFKGGPDDVGEVELGYGLAEGHRGQGYMTEAARALIDWAFCDARCQAITAQGVLSENTPSQRVLERLGMTCYHRDTYTILAPDAPHLGEKPHMLKNKRVLTFLGLTLALSTIWWFLMLAGVGPDSLRGLYILGLMWSPGVAAILTNRLSEPAERTPLGWRPGRPRYLLLGYALPLLYAVPVYALVWGAGWGALDTTPLGGQAWPAWLASQGTLGVLTSLLTALGEEIGWRGFLVPELAKGMSRPRAALVSGLIWAAWHLPLILGGAYSGGAPLTFSVACFVVLVVGVSYAYAWVTLRSGSLWPAALLHATHNLFIQNVFDVLTRDTGPTAWLTGEFGLGLAVTGALVGVIFWRLLAQKHAQPAGYAPA